MTGCRFKLLQSRSFKSKCSSLGIEWGCRSPQNAWARRPALTDASRRGDGGCARNLSAPFQPQGAPRPAQARPSAASPAGPLPRVPAPCTPPPPVRRQESRRKGRGSAAASGSTQGLQGRQVLRVGFGKGRWDDCEPAAVSGRHSAPTLCPWTKRPTPGF